jgi:hypothetical protein
MEQTFTWTNFEVTAGFSNPYDDTLYLFTDDTLKSWDTAGTKLPYTWKSKLFKLPRAATFQFGQVKTTSAGSTTMELLIDQTSEYTKTLTNDIEFILPSTIGTDCELVIEGNGNISEIQLTEDVEELT